MTTNLLSDENTSFEAGTTGDWVPSGCTLTNAAVGWVGSRSLQLTKTGAAGQMWASLVVGVPGGGSYRFRFGARAATALRAVSAIVSWLDGRRRLITTSPATTVTPTLLGSFTAVTAAAATAPADARFAWIRATVDSAAANEIHYLDSATFTRNFDGENLLLPEAWSFEGGTVGGWTAAAGTGQSISTLMGGHHGTRAMQFWRTTAGDNPTVISPTVPLRGLAAGARVGFSAWLLPYGTIRAVQLTVQWMGPDVYTLPTVLLRSTSFTGQETRDWALVGGSDTVPPGATGVRVQISALGTGLPTTEYHFVDDIIMEPGLGACRRRAWLTLGTRQVALEDEAAGYYCRSLDLGWPAVREVANNRAHHDGIDDRTEFFGARTVTAEVVAVRGAGARIDQVASSFGPFMVASSRPVLHYVLDRPGLAERQITVRPAGYAWPIAGNDERQVQLQFVAPDPYVYDPYENVGRQTMGVGGDSTVAPVGDIAVEPYIFINGPINGNWSIRFWHPLGNSNNGPFYGGLAGNGTSAAAILTNSGFEFDCARHTAFLIFGGVRGADKLGELNWSLIKQWGGWPRWPTNVGTINITFGFAGQANTVTYFEWRWRAGYLS